METIKRKKGVKYRESIMVEGQRIKGPWFNRKTDAVEWKKVMQSRKYIQLAQGEFANINKQITLDDFVARWLSEVVCNDNTKKTFENYERIYRVHFRSRFAHLKLSQIREEHGRQLIAALRERGHNAKGINTIVGVFKTILLRAKKEKYLTVSPFENISKLREELKVDTYWTKAEINQFFEANIGHTLFPLFFTAVHTGMRLGELCGLGWDRIDFDNNLIYVTRVRDKYGLRDTTKAGEKRTIPIESDLKMWLQFLFHRQRENGNNLVFCRESGEVVPYGHIYRDFKRAQQSAGLSRSIRFHDLRHTFASIFMLNGGNLFDLQKILEHSDYKMTLRYAHFGHDHLRSAKQFMNMGTSELTKLHVPDLTLNFNSGKTLALISNV